MRQILECIAAALKLPGSGGTLFPPGRRSFHSRRRSLPQTLKTPKRVIPLANNGRGTAPTPTDQLLMSFLLTDISAEKDLGGQKESRPGLPPHQ